MNSFALIGELLIRSAVLLIAAEVLCRFARGPAARHRLLSWAFALLALLPLFCGALPRVQVPLWKPVPQAGAHVTVQEFARSFAWVSALGVRPQPVQAARWLLLVWAIGAALAAFPLAAGAFVTRRLRARATPFTGLVREQFVGCLEPFRWVDGVFLCEDLAVPLTCGVWRRRILLPQDAGEWPLARLKAVLAHELAHVHRQDVAIHGAAHIIAALWWFQPLVWFVRHHLRGESELACDGEALRCGILPSVYAEELLAIARAVCRSPFFSSAGISMARCSSLERRVRAILAPPSPRVLSRPAQICFSVLMAGAELASSTLSTNSKYESKTGDRNMRRTVLSALLAAAGASAATVSGSIHDANGAPVSEARVFVYNPDTRIQQDIATGADGTFRIETAAAGQYILHVEKTGFASIFREFNLPADAKVDRQFTLVATDSMADADARSPEERDPKQVRIGGKVAQSNIQTKVQPKYPASAKAAALQGTVELEAVVAKDGTPCELRVLRSPGDELSQSALEAVRQWRYKPVLLNGEPIEVITDIVVNYSLAP